jgi:hypothetical protein
MAEGLKTGRVGVLATTSPSTLARVRQGAWRVLRAMTEHGVTLVTANGPWDAKT